MPEAAEAPRPGRTGGLDAGESSRADSNSEPVAVMAHGQCLLVEQYLDFCLDVGDCFSIMDRGSIVAEGLNRQLDDDIVKQHLTV